MLQLTHLRCEYLVNPLGIETPHPRLSWVLASADPSRRGTRQAAYQVEVASDGAVTWDSGRVESDETAHIAYQGDALRAGRRYTWRVRVWDEAGAQSDWSEPAEWGMGWWGPGWTTAKAGDDPRERTAAAWIGGPPPAAWREDESQPSPMLRKEFSLPGPVRRAVLYASALGVYELRLNGARVGDRILAPEWTDYRRKAQYQAYDVTALLREGGNAIGALLGPGWYAGQLGLGQAFTGLSRGTYGRWLRLIALLRVELASGETVEIASDGSWKATLDGPIRASDLLAGEWHDARRDMPGWDAPGFDDAAWAPAVTGHGAPLVAQPNEPIRVTQTLAPVALTEPRPGVFIYDLGQNMVGWARMRLRGQAGDAIRFRHGEALNPDGTLYRDNLRLADPDAPQQGAQQEDRYVCRGGGEETFEPRFTYHGFRYVEVTGLSARPALGDLAGCVFHSSSPDAGQLECSSPLLNKILSAIRWTQRGNLMSAPTDCPQRDERLGWSGDIQVYSQTAIYTMDMAAFFTKWLRDFREAQAEDGRFPDFAPHPFDPEARFSGNPGWGDAGVIVPWRLYLNYGDMRILEEAYPAARRYVDWSAARNPDLIWRNRDQLTPLWYGDWLNADTFVDLPDVPRTGGQVPKEVYSTAFFAYSTQLVARMAEVLGRPQEARQYHALAKNIRTAFNRAFVSPDGRILGDTQAGYALALHFDLLPDRLRKRAAGRMVGALDPYHGALSTGIQSTVRMMIELVRHGYAEVAYRLMTRTDIPSWGYMVQNGATTIWERWDGWAKGRGFQNPGMNSFNHYAIGAVGEWMWRVIAGINPDESGPGYRRVVIRPVPGGGLSWAKASYPSMRGLIEAAWAVDPRGFSLDVSIPPGVVAAVHVPAPAGAVVSEGGLPVEQAAGVSAVARDADTVRVEAGSGTYHFRSEHPRAL
jgi:alpha-L-rhamnosidase